MSNSTVTERLRRDLKNPLREALRILCVEDNDGDFVLLQEHLRMAGFAHRPELHRANTLQTALRMLGAPEEETPFDVILLDLSLPDSQGTETYNRLRAMSPRLPVIILSGSSNNALAEDMVFKGAQDYLPKDSLTPDMLMRSVLYALSRQRYREGLEKLTERLKRTTEELRTTQGHLAQAEKIDSITRLSASVAHEVKNPLGTIQMGLDYLKNKFADADASVGNVLNLMQEAVSRADSVIYDMLSFSRMDGVVHLEPVKVNDLVVRTMRMVEHEINRHNLHLEMELADDMPSTLADPIKIEQVLINLLMNSIQAMTKHGRLEVRTYRGHAGKVPRNEGLREMNLLRRGDDVAVIDIRDYGPGIPRRSWGGFLSLSLPPSPQARARDLALRCARALSKCIVASFISATRTSLPGFVCAFFSKFIFRPDRSRHNSLP